MLYRLLAIWVSCVIALTGCSMKSENVSRSSPTSFSADEDYSYGYESRTEMDFEGVDVGGLMSAPKQAPQVAHEAPAWSPTPANPAPEAATSSEPPPPESTRKVHYNGWARLRVTRTEELVETIAREVTDAGGFVEERTLHRITVRVPVDDFRATFARVLELGDVLAQSLTASDVTDAVNAMDLRLKTAKDTRTRLQELLAHAQEQNEKLQLLREIKRLTEDIDRMESQLRTLEGLASFSRLTVEAVPRQALTDGSDRIELDGFGFIQNLSPFRRDVAWSGKVLKLDTPAGMVALDDRNHFVAEGPEGTALWTGKLENDPAGDASFWIEAAQERLTDEFAETETLRIGSFEVLRLVEAGVDDPYRYLIGFRTDGKKLEIIEIFYPSETHETRFESAIAAVLGGGAS